MNEDSYQELARLREQVAKQEKMASLGMLTAGIAHEIQNPLNFVINFSKMSGKLLEDLEEILSGAGEGLSETSRTTSGASVRTASGPPASSATSCYTPAARRTNICRPTSAA